MPDRLSRLVWSVAGWLVPMAFFALPNCTYEPHDAPGPNLQTGPLPRNGAIVDLSADFLIDYSFGTFQFERQLLIERRGGGAFADDGDSGSLVLDFKTRKPLALMFSTPVVILRCALLVRY